MIRARRLLPVVSFLGLAACKPDLGAPASTIAGPRILAVRQEPPEANPGVAVVVDVLAVDASGRLQLPPESYLWSLCVASKPPAENNVVNATCSYPGGEGLMPVPGAVGPSVTVTIPSNACAQQGPDLPPTKEGEPPLRSRDADVTGGYYQPIGLDVVIGPGTSLETFALERIGCNLPNVAPDVVRAFQKRYTVNTSPVLAGVSVAGAPVTEAIPFAVAPGAVVTFEAAWTPESREAYPVYDVAKREIVDHFEELSVSWYATAGDFDRDRTGRTELETTPSITNVWTAPLAPGLVHLWLVLRDNRGGITFAEFLLSVA